jgi:hypothetical protein
MKSTLVIFIEKISQGTLATVQTVLVDSHSDTSTTSLVGTIFAGAVHLTIITDLVEFEYGKLDILVHSLNLLRLGVGLLLSLLSSTSQTKNKMKSGLLLDVVIRESASILKLLSSENQTLLIRRNYWEKVS